MLEFTAEQYVCVMYYSTTGYSCPQHNQRSSFYSVSGVPVAWFDGYEQSLGGLPSGSMVNYYRPIVNSHLQDPASLALSLDMTINGTSGSVSGLIEVTENVPAGDYLVYVVLYEAEADRTPNLARDFPVWQETLTATAVGQTQNVSGNFTVDSGWNTDNLHAILFVQLNGGNKAILQAGRAASEPAAAMAIITGLGEGPDNSNDVHGYLTSDLTAPDTMFSAYGAGRYGVNVAVGNVDGDATDEIITGPGPGAVFGPQVRIFDYNGTPLGGSSIFAYGTLKYGVNVAGGDIDGDGFAEIITGAGPGAVFGPHVRAFNYDNSGAMTAVSGVSYFAYGTPKWGVNVCAGDIDGDGYDEIITGAGPGAIYGAHVRGWNVDGGAAVAMPGVSFLAYGTPKFGVNVACGDIDGDGFDEIVTGAGPGAVFSAHVRAFDYDGSAITPIGGVSFFAFDGYRYGACVGTGDVDGDGMDELLVGPGPDPAAPAMVRVYNYDGGSLELLYDFGAYSTEPTTHGVNVTAGQF